MKISSQADRDIFDSYIEQDIKSFNKQIAAIRKKIEIFSYNNNSLLQLAIIDNRMDFFNALMKYPEKVVLDHQNVDGASPLILAIYLDKLNIVDSLLTAGADVDISDNSGNSALHYAAKRADDRSKNFLEYLKITEDLISYGAVINCKNNMGKTPYDLANNSKVRVKLIDEQNISYTPKLSELCFA